ncbi:MAG: hypothetical protein JO167_06260 [Alphaproteobacteria bacterium]|nr:hypothetical protein [Alphaproteobacteria bacterium]MBV9540854.1 hypothetical protein [Alphaproteobacteria bacterium]MBV9902950.1 hypothetical protein [Alphaproteobacteria bacterium]
MRKWICAAGALALCSGVAMAADGYGGEPPASNAFVGNTVVFVDKGGMESHTHYKADGTFDGTVPSMSYNYKGTWEMKDGALCRTFDPAVPGRTNPDCDPADPSSHAVGDSWATPDGGKITLSAGVI